MQNEQDIKETSNNLKSEDEVKNVGLVEPDSEERENQDNKKRRMTLSDVPHFHAVEKLKKPKKKHNKCEKFKELLMHSVENIFVQILILILACYSLFHQDIMFLCLPKVIDVPFEHTTEATFFFFLIEFIIFLIAKKKFVGSFYFYLDMISLISLLPEVHLIWSPLLTLIAGQK